jgi:hypothetical protein
MSVDAGDTRVVGLLGFESHPLKATYEQAMIGNWAQRLMRILPPIVAPE